MGSEFDAAIAALYDARHEVAKLMASSPPGSDMRAEALSVVGELTNAIERLTKAQALDARQEARP